ncbi:putative aminoadipate reductase [Neolentinus lepideus HHB14362 ss-1]|uniref:Putative aminoadipate reductase n=1 Tax=Neolentinus lepideus HHB14362 ss-1 TaxID=1314782 RepID=A0A165RLP8_9AGAM|nr:putative aminoadipate reductase [Neolentinus lepideus HHB14362 ss-1]
MAPRTLPPLDGSITVLPGFVDFHHKHNPDLPILRYAPDGSDEVVNISFAEFSRATHRMAHAIRSKDTGKDREVVALMAHCDTVLYLPLMVAMVRAGLVPFFISPRNSPAAIYNMLSKTSCHRILTTSAFLQPLLEGCKAEFAANSHDLHVEEIPTLAQAFPKLGLESKSDPFQPYPALEYEPVMDDVCLYLHSSGSTGFPKPIPQTNKSVLHWCSFPSVTEARYHPHQLTFGVMMLPSFHTLGIYMQLYAPLVTGDPSVVFPPKAPAPPVMPNPQNTLEHCQRGGATAVVVVPTFLELWAQKEESVEYLKTMEIVAFAGGPLSAKAGDVYVSNGVKISAVYGGTEFGAPSHMFDIHPDNKAQHIKKDPKDWAWMRLGDQVKARWMDQGDGTYELHMITNKNHQLSVENLEDVKGYATSDLWEKHPTVKGLWRIVGRTDDVLVLASGEKTVPAPIEGHILHSPMVQGTLMFGRGRDQVGIIIEPTPEFAIDPKDEKALGEFRNKIWPVVEEANKDAPAFSRLFKEMILVSDPKKPLPRAAKGTVQRKPTIALYEKEIDALYEAVESSFKSVNVEPPKSWTTTDLVPWLLQDAEQINHERKVDPEGDLFEQGFDSLSAIFLRNRITGALRLSVDPGAKQALTGLTQNIVYNNPTIIELATAVAALVSPTTLDGLHDKAPAKAILTMFEKYSKDFPKASGSSAQKTGDAVVLLTGSTGSLGSYILASLLGDERVARVYTFNRKSSTGPPEERQKVAFEDKGLSVELLASTKLVFLEGDAATKNLGLVAELHSEIHSSVTHIIHNAWRLDFNLSLSSFEPNIKATRSLIDFALTSKAGPSLKFIFTSSISVGQSWDSSKGPYPEKVVAEPEWAVGGGYGEGKYVVEQVLAAASAYGLNSTSLRIGQICGGLPKGAWATSDWVPILVKSSLVLGSLPDTQGVVSWVPMHTVASVISDVAFGSGKAPLALNVVHPKPAMWSAVMCDVASALARDSSQPLPLVPFPEWIDNLEKKAMQAKEDDYDKIPAIRLLDFFKHFAEAHKSLDVAGADNVEAGGIVRFAIDEVRKGSKTIGRVDQLSTADAERWVEYWRSKRFI